MLGARDHACGRCEPRGRAAAHCLRSAVGQVDGHLIDGGRRELAASRSPRRSVHVLEGADEAVRVSSPTSSRRYEIGVQTGACTGRAWSAARSAWPRS